TRVPRTNLQQSRDLTDVLGRWSFAFFIPNDASGAPRPWQPSRGRVERIRRVALLPKAATSTVDQLRPSARHLESSVWHSRDAARMRRMIEAWDQHCLHPELPRTLAVQMRGSVSMSCA